MKKMTQEKLDKLIKEHDKGGAFARQITAHQTCWDSGIKILRGCGHMNVPKFKVEIEVLADEKIKKLQSYYPSLEWLAYLVGKIDHEKQYVLVEDLVIPDSQRVTGANVYDVEYGWSDGKAIIGVIHSHHSMGAFFSGTDDAYINQNHDVSIVVSTNQSSPIKGQVRIKTPCDAYVLAEDLEFSIKYPKVLDEKKFEKEFTSKIKSNTPTYGYRGGNFLSRGFGRVGKKKTTKSEEEKLRVELRKFYANEDVEEFIANGTAVQELREVSDLVVVPSNEFEFNGEDGVIPWWDKVEDDEWDANGQNGMHQTSFGVPVNVEDKDHQIWDLDEEDITVESEKEDGSVESVDIENNSKTKTPLYMWLEENHPKLLVECEEYITTHPDSYLVTACSTLDQVVHDEWINSIEVENEPIKEVLH